MNLEAKLSSPDAILEEATLENDARLFVSNGGQPENLVRCLSESYVGTAQMCNLLGEWLSILNDGRDKTKRLIDGDDDDNDPDADRNDKKRRRVTHTGSTSDANNNNQQQLAVANNNRASGGDARGAAAIVEEHLKTLIIQRFDPKKADTIWDQQSAPKWLQFMISQHGWRSLVYRLSTDHKDCLMLNFAIQSISDAGHQGELASLATASTYFSVFNRVLMASLTALENADDDALSVALPGLVAMAARTQHTFAYTLAVLRRLASALDNAQLDADDRARAVAAAAARLARELEQRAEHRYAAAWLCNVTRTSFFSVPATTVALRLANTAAAHSAALASVALMTSANATNPSDIIQVTACVGGLCQRRDAQLFNAYTAPPPTPPVALLRHATLLELLAKDLFEPTSARRLHQAHRHKYLHLLALAAAGADAAFATTRQTLDAAQTVCVRGPLAAHERGEARAALRAAVALPVGALVVLVWLEAQWGERTFFTVSYDAELFGELLALLIEAAERHPLQHARVLRVLAAPATLRAGADLDALVALELKRHATDAAAGLILQGRCSLAALAAVRSWLGVLDHSLVRRFLDRVVASIAPPFSRAFVGAFAAFCADEASLLALRGASLHGVELMLKFVDNAGRAHASLLAPLRDTLTPLHAALLAEEARRRK